MEYRIWSRGSKFDIHEGGREILSGRLFWSALEHYSAVLRANISVSLSYFNIIHVGKVRSGQWPAIFDNTIFYWRIKMPIIVNEVGIPEPIEGQESDNSDGSGMEEGQGSL